MLIENHSVQFAAESIRSEIDQAVAALAENFDYFKVFAWLSGDLEELQQLPPPKVDIDPSSDRTSLFTLFTPPSAKKAKGVFA